MTRHRMRLVEQSILEGSGDFTVEADTPELAAAVLLQAHDAARKECCGRVVLPDGLAETQSVCRWACRVEPREVVESRVFCIRLDDVGNEVGGEVEPDEGPCLTDTDGLGSAGLPGPEPQL